MAATPPSSPDGSMRRASSPFVEPSRTPSPNSHHEELVHSTFAVLPLSIHLPPYLLANLARLNRRAYAAVSPHLYNHVVVNEHNVDSLLFGILHVASRHESEKDGRDRWGSRAAGLGRAHLGFLPPDYEWLPPKILLLAMVKHLTIQDWRSVRVIVDMSCKTSRRMVSSTTSPWDANPRPRLPADPAAVDPVQTLFATCDALVIECPVISDMIGETGLYFEGEGETASEAVRWSTGKGDVADRDNWDEERQVRREGLDRARQEAGMSAGDQEWLASRERGGGVDDADEEELWREESRHQTSSPSAVERNIRTLVEFLRYCVNHCPATRLQPSIPTLRHLCLHLPNEARVSHLGRLAVEISYLSLDTLALHAVDLRSITGLPFVARSFVLYLAPVVRFEAFWGGESESHGWLVAMYLASRFGSSSLRIRGISRSPMPLTAVDEIVFRQAEVDRIPEKAISLELDHCVQLQQWNGSIVLETLDATTECYCCGLV
ncbi:hypothetical protein IAT38_004810 [Cryptococcus sp. DSM 104549]